MANEDQKNQVQKTKVVDEDSPEVLQMHIGYRGILGVVFLQIFEDLQFRLDGRF